MKLKVQDKRKKINDLMEWHSWFAWRPIFIQEELQWVWLETVERRLYYHSREIGLQCFSKYGFLYRTKNETTRNQS